MITRPLDASGDIMPVASLSQMASGAEAVGIAIRHRVSLVEGEWWEDEDLGFGIPEFLGNARGDSGVEMLGMYVSSYIADTPEVTAVNGSVTFENHAVNYTASVAAGGARLETEVDLSALL